MPTSTSLVTNLPADFNTFGQAVDTSMSELLGGTTGQVLSKTSATNMDFTWVTPTDQTPLTTKGDLFAFSTVDARLPAGANETRLVADSAQTLGLKYVADTTNYAIAAKADLLVGTAADTLAALTVGTNGQVLTADSTVSPTGLKWATPSASAAFVGVGVYDTNVLGQSIPNTTYTALTYDSENYDTDSFHSTSSNTSRLTIPTGKGGKYEVTAFVQWDNNATGFRIVVIYLNGTYNKSIAVETSSGYLGQPGSYTMTLAAGDYIEIYVYQNSGSARNCDENKYFQATYMGA
jgi:hypothetical protein